MGRTCGEPDEIGLTAMVCGIGRLETRAGGAETDHVQADRRRERVPVVRLLAERLVNVTEKEQ